MIRLFSKRIHMQYYYKNIVFILCGITVISIANPGLGRHARSRGLFRQSVTFISTTIINIYNRYKKVSDCEQGTVVTRKVVLITYSLFGTCQTVHQYTRKELFSIKGNVYLRWVHTEHGNCNFI